MAIIGTIRNNSWILIVALGGALLAFIAMDMIQSGNKNAGNAQLEMGAINGKKLTRKQFERTYSTLYGNSQGDADGRRDYLWNYFVEEGIVLGQADVMGLGVCKDELTDLEFGPNPSRIMVQRFPSQNNPQAVDRATLNRYKSIIDEGRVDEAIANRELGPTFKSFWAHQRKEIRKDKLQTKMDNLVSKAMYTPTWMAKMGFEEQSQYVDFTVVKVPFDEIDPTEISLSDADYQAYVDANAGLYSQDEESRVMDYLVFDIIPSAADSAANKKIVADLISDFAATDADADSSFVIRNSGIITEIYSKKSDLSPLIADTLMTLPIGSVYGPYEEAGSYKIVKVLDKKIIPDSVKARHILLRATTNAEFFQAKSTLDSLQNLIETGVSSFDSLALKFGTDGTSSKGGDLGYSQLGKMVGPFNDLIFYKAKKGELHIVGTQFGLHLVEVTGKKFINNDEGVKVAYISEAIIPTKDTEDAVYSKASEYVSTNRDIESFKSAASAAGLKIASTTALKVNDYQIQGLGAGEGDAKNVIKWSYQNEEGDISPSIYSFKDPTSIYDNKFVAFALTLVQEEGLPKASSIKSQIQTLVLNEKRGALLADQLKGMDMDAVASKYKVPVDTVTNISFNSAYIAALGAGEYKVQATALALDQNQVSAPIIGKTGVFIVKSTKKPTLATPSGLPQIQKAMLTKNRVRVPGQLLKGLVKNSDVEDSRAGN